jgi:hypothetical protein
MKRQIRLLISLTMMLYCGVGWGQSRLGAEPKNPSIKYLIEGEDGDRIYAGFSFVDTTTGQELKRVHFKTENPFLKYTTGIDTAMEKYGFYHLDEKCNWKELVSPFYDLNVFLPSHAILQYSLDLNAESGHTAVAYTFKLFSSYDLIMGVHSIIRVYDSKGNMTKEIFLKNQQVSNPDVTHSGKYLMYFDDPVSDISEDYYGGDTTKILDAPTGEVIYFDTEEISRGWETVDDVFYRVGDKPTMYTEYRVIMPKDRVYYYKRYPLSTYIGKYCKKGVVQVRNGELCVFCWDTNKIERIIDYKTEYQLIKF